MKSLLLVSTLLAVSVFGQTPLQFTSDFTLTITVSFAGFTTTGFPSSMPTTTGFPSSASSFSSFTGKRGEAVPKDEKSATITVDKFTQKYINLFNREVQKKRQGEFTTSIDGTMAYDFPSQKLKFMPAGSSDFVIYDFVPYLKYTQENGQCHCARINATDPDENFTEMPLYFLPANAGAGVSQTVTVHGQSVACTRYTTILSFGGVAGMNMTFWVAGSGSSQYVAKTQTIMDLAGTSINIVEEFYNFHNQAPAASVFTPPSGCTCAPPPPPTTPVVGSCPGNAPAGCACGAFSYCTAINYPVPSYINVAFFETSIQAFVTTYAAMGSFSAQCQTALRDVICANTFPRCTTNGELLPPCGSLCLPGSQWTCTNFDQSCYSLANPIPTTCNFNFGASGQSSTTGQSSGAGTTGTPATTGTTGNPCIASSAALCLDDYNTCELTGGCDQTALTQCLNTLQSCGQANPNARCSCFASAVTCITAASCTTDPTVVQGVFPACNGMCPAGTCPGVANPCDTSAFATCSSTFASCANGASDPCSCYGDFLTCSSSAQCQGEASFQTAVQACIANCPSVCSSGKRKFLDLDFAPKVSPVQTRRQLGSNCNCLTRFGTCLGSAHCLADTSYTSYQAACTAAHCTSCNAGQPTPAGGESGASFATLSSFVLLLVAFLLY